MPFVREFYDPETLALMTRALKEAMREAGDQARTNAELNVAMANRIMTAVAGGERDLDALKEAALSAITPVRSPPRHRPARGSVERAVEADLDAGQRDPHAAQVAGQSRHEPSQQLAQRVEGKAPPLD